MAISKNEKTAESNNTQQTEKQETAKVSKEPREVRKSKSDEEKSAKIIYDFMLDSDSGELEALRAVIVTINSNGGVTIEDRNSINRFLNHNLSNENLSRDMVVAHRIKRNGLLVQSVSRFLNKEQTVNAGILLSSIAIDNNSVEFAIKVISDKNSTYGTWAKTNNVVNSNPQG